MAVAARPALPLRWNGAAQPPLVGRRRELSTVEAAWEQVLRGCRQVLLIGGEPGAGKSRLLAHLCTVLFDEGACVLVGTCLPELGQPYQPLVEPVEALLAGPAVTPSAADRLKVLAGRAEDQGEGPEHRRSLYDAVVDQVLALAREGRVVIALEDLQWAGRPALELLSYLIERTAEAPVLVVATHRTTAPDRSESLTGTLSRLQRLDGVHRLDLAGLDTDDVAELLARETGLPVHRVRGPADVLRRQTGGNPFFLRELWRDLSARGGLAALGTASVEAPASVRDALQARLRPLSEPQRQTVELAAVLGEEVDAQTLVAASDWSVDATCAALDDAVACGLLEPVAGGGYRFVHALARHAVLELLPASRRAHQHARVAQLIEARPAGSAGRVQALAHHYAEAHLLGHADKAVRFLVEAARAAERSLAHEDAARWYQRAALLRDDGRQALLLAAARSQLLGGDFARARELAEQVAGDGDPAERLQAAVVFEAASWRPGLPGHRAVELLTTALAGMATGTEDALRVRATASLGRALAFTGNASAAAALGAEAIERARLGGDDGLLAHALQASLWHGLRPADGPAKLERAIELSEIAHRTGDLGQLGPAAYYRGVLAYLQGEPQAWATAEDDLVRVSQGTGQDFFEYMAGCLAYGRQFVAGDLAAAQRTCAAMLVLGERFGTDRTDGPSAVQEFMVRREAGGLEQVRPLITGREDPEAHWAPGLLALYTALGLDDAARRLLDRLMARPLTAHRDSAQWPAVLAFLVEAALQLGDADAVRALRPDLAEYSGCNLVAGQFVALFGSADRYLGAVDSLLGRPDDAERCFAAALALDRRTGSPLHEAHTLAALRLHRRRQGCDDPDLTRQVLEIAGPLGLVAVLRQVSPEAAPRTGVSPEAAPRTDGLTAREAEVLELLGQGLLNRQIGARLFISEHTAANHVRSILAKTGSANRTQAALYAAAHRSV